MSIGSQCLKYKTNLFKSLMDEPFNPATNGVILLDSIALKTNHGK